MLQYNANIFIEKKPVVLMGQKKINSHQEESFFNRQPFRDEDDKLRFNKQLGGSNSILKFAQSFTLTIGQILSTDLWLFFLPFGILVEFLRVTFNVREQWLTRNKHISQTTKIVLNTFFGLLFTISALGAVFLAVTYANLLPYVACAIFAGRFFYNLALTIGYIARLCDPTAGEEYKIHCRRQRDKYAINTACNLFGAIGSAVVIGLGLVTGNIAQVAIMSTVGIVASMNAFYLGAREFLRRPVKIPEATVFNNEEITDMAKTHKPGTGSFFYRDIIHDLRKIKGATEEQIFLKQLINQKIDALLREENKSNKTEDKYNFLVWLDNWLLDPTLRLTIDDKSGITSPEINNMHDLMHFLNQNPEFKDNVFSSPRNGIGETEGLLRAVAEYLDIQHLVPNQVALTMAMAHKPGTGSFFYQNILDDLNKIKGSSQEPVFLEKLIEKKIDALHEEQKRTYFKQKNKHDNKCHFLQWLKKWLLDASIPLTTLENSTETIINNMDDLNAFLNTHSEFKDHVFSSNKKVGETEGLFKVVEEYLIKVRANSICPD